MRKEPSTEAKFAFIFGLAMLSVMLCWFPVEPVSAGGPSPQYPTEAELTSDLALKANKADPAFTGSMTAANASFSGNLESATTVAANDGTVKTAVSISGTNGIMGTTSDHPVLFLTNSIPRLTVSKSGAASFSGSLHAAGQMTAANASFSGQITMASRSLVIAYNNANKEWPDSSAQTASFTTEVTDSLSEFDGTTFTAKYAGVYYVYVPYGFVSNATGIRFAEVFVDGASAVPNCQSSVTGTLERAQCCGFLNLAAGAQVTVKFYQNSGGVLSMYGNFTGFQIMRLL